ncbi:armadillo repeat protein [Plectosphaerella plurivora]|uniref:Armadillo repeat protein n=1 Tax=Plectosphaerella plurivora TaxID=936078 RepID=A0A9P8VCR2_9PEZI|nr:armadillo repeat protein [Plectosphaerella plurivora]
MARDSGAPLLAYIHNARNCSEQVAALRSLKNDIVGHAQRKETWLVQGALEPVVALAQSPRSSSKTASGKPGYSTDAQTLSDEESVRLQALQVLGSFASGGTFFFSALVASQAIPAILSNISPDSNPPLVVLAAIKTLTGVTNTCADPLETQTLADELFQPIHIQALANVCARSNEWRIQTLQNPITLVATLISRLCDDEGHALALAESDVLDHLAAELAAFAVASGHVIPGADILGKADGRLQYIPEPAPAGANLAVVLEALAAIVSDSKYRAYRLLYSPAILAVFPGLELASSRALLGMADLDDDWIDSHIGVGAMDILLPAPPRQTSRGSGRRFAHLGFVGGGEATQAFARPTPSNKNGNGLPVIDASRFDTPCIGIGEDGEVQRAPLVSWLILLVRTRNDIERLMAASLLTSLFKSGLEIRQLREPSVGLLIVPVLLDMLQGSDAAARAHPQSPVDKRTRAAWKILESTPAVISRLITDSEPLQTVAYDCGAVTILSKLLKEAYEPVPDSAYPKMWSPTPDTGMDVESDSASCRLGPRTNPPLLAHRIKLRESTLKAIGSLAGGKEDYRKAFIEQDIMPYLVQSLSVNPCKPSTPRERPRGDEPDGPVVEALTSAYGHNPLSVIIAACHAVRAHSRSISILRTSLVDHNVAIPVLRFLKHPDVDVQVAASAAICNLVTEVSPTREILAQHGVMTVLCEHAHSHTAALRLNALWALKHFVTAASPTVKRQCLEQLQSGWLVRLVCDDTEDEALFRSKHDLSSGADGRDDPDGDVEMDQNELTSSKSWIGRSGIPSDAEGKPAAWAIQAEARKAALRDVEANPQRRARNDDLAIQEQGLDLIRNLIPSSGASSIVELTSESTDMIDYLFLELGQDRFFDILAKKLQAKVLRGGPRRGSTAQGAGAPGESRILYPQAKIIEAVIYILVHIAASVPHHRQLVIAQPALLKLLGNHFSSREKEVREALCHLMSNLTWQDDENDARACGLRAHELKKLGMLSKLEGLEDDPELNVRERAKTAIWQMKQASSL